MVTTVDPNGPAARQNLSEGALLIAVNGVEVGNQMNEVTSAINAAGDTADFIFGV